MGEARRKKLWKEDLKMKCADCDAWVNVEGEVDGVCRRYPPQCLLVPMPQKFLDKTGNQAVGVGVQSFFPKTKGDVCCGEFKERKQ